MSQPSELVDPEAAVEDLGLGLEDYKEFLGDLRDYLGGAMPELAKAVVARDLQNIREHGHAMKGALRNLRFIKAGDLAFRLENIGAGREQGDAQSVFAEFQSILAETWDYLASKGF